MYPNWIKKSAGIIQYFIGGALIISGLLKLFGLPEYVQMIQDLSSYYYNNLILLGLIAVGSGALFIIPRTFTYGFVSVLVFLGGTISAHMQHGDPYFAQILFVLLTISVAHIKRPEWFISSK